MHLPAFDAISKKAGHDFTPQQDEKITDAARGAYEKYSGVRVEESHLSVYLTTNSITVQGRP